MCNTVTTVAFIRWPWCLIYRYTNINTQIQSGRFKTGLCPALGRPEGCPRGDKCTYAHSEEERVEDRYHAQRQTGGEQQTKELQACFEISKDTLSVGETLQITDCSKGASNHSYAFGNGETSADTSPEAVYQEGGEGEGEVRHSG